MAEQPIVTIKVREWRECEECGEPAMRKISFLLEHYRSNPASSAYRRDDCSWCSDLDKYACLQCERAMFSKPPAGYESASAFYFEKFEHMGWEWRDKKLTPEQQAKVVELLGLEAPISPIQKVLA